MKTVVALFVCAMVITGGASYLLTRNYYQDLLDRVHPIYAQDTTYKFLRPLIGISLPGDQFNNSFPDVRDEIRSTIDAQPPNTVSRYAIYLRDLNSGNWLGINEDEKFDPASLLKVVVAIAAQRQAEDVLGYGSSSLVFTKEIADVNKQISFAQPTDLKVGQSYSVPFLVKKELVDSDNGAVDLLLSSLKDDEVNNVYDELSIPRPDNNNSIGYKLTALEYSRFFRILYNGTLNIDWTHSEELLDYLSQTKFTSGLVAGVPPSVPVAHKYGEHVGGTNGVADDIELSDCGIVYAPKHPYFLCVMTQGKDPDALSKTIAQVSKVVYQKISSSSDAP